MAAVRKSDGSGSGSWFRRGSTPSLRKRRTRLESTLKHDSRSVTEPSKGQRRSSQNTSPSVNVRVEGLAASQSPASTLLQPNPRENNLQSNSPRLSVVPTAKALPLWLLRLNTIHRYSAIAAFLLVAASLTVYGLTVYTQELWSQGYSRLQKLQRDERQITTTNATLTNKMAEEAEIPSAGLISPTPGRTIFLSPVPYTPEVVTPSVTPNPPTQPLNSRLGY